MTLECLGFLFFMKCTAPEPAVPVARFCVLAEPIRAHKNDTAETKRQVRKHNAQGVAVCGWEP